jgi:hypothetical protein
VSAASSRKLSIIRFFALDKPWPYLVVSCYSLTMALVWAGNPLLPIEYLASNRWAWHHIPEIFGFLFFGVYLASLGYLHAERLNYLDSATLILLATVTLTYAAVISYNEMFRIVLAIVFVPSFSGYFLARLRKIQKTTKVVQ